MQTEGRLRGDPAAGRARGRSWAEAGPQRARGGAPSRRVSTDPTSTLDGLALSIVRGSEAAVAFATHAPTVAPADYILILTGHNRTFRLGIRQKGLTQPLGSDSPSYRYDSFINETTCLTRATLWTSVSGESTRQRAEIIWRFLSRIRAAFLLKNWGA